MTGLVPEVGFCFSDETCATYDPPQHTWTAYPAHGGIASDFVKFMGETYERAEVVTGLREERLRLRNLLAIGLGYVEGFSKAAELQSADDWKEKTLKELGLE